jgi:hypothetical protein
LPQIFLGGHSLGGGVGTLLSYAMQSYLDDEMGAGAPTVNAVLSAPINAGGPEFVGLFNERINARRIVFKYDSAPQVGRGLLEAFTIERIFNL